MRQARDTGLPKILFVAGMGRSGSTLLGRLLALEPGVLVGGELGQLWGNIETVAHLCGCGVLLLQCPFWKRVGEAAFGGFEQIPPATLRRLRMFWERRREIAAHLLLSPRRVHIRGELVQYGEHMACVLRALREVSGCDVVVDTSKTPAHLAALLTVAEAEVHVVHLVRDSRAVAHSFLKRRRRPDAVGEIHEDPVAAWKSAIFWMSINFAVSRLRRSAASARILRYEDFAEAPADALKLILKDIGQMPTVTAPQGGWNLVAQHTVAGNLSRMRTGPTAVQPDRGWEHDLPVSSRWLVTACSWPGLWVYSYDLVPSARGSRRVRKNPSLDSGRGKE